MSKSFRPSSWFAILMSACLLMQPAAVGALALGKLSVQSALGESVQAEIEIPEITQNEANTMRLAIGSTDAFKLSGLEYSSFLNALVITPKQRSNGSIYLEIRSTRAIAEPFLDLVLEVSWATGKIVRDYTLLFDPPKTTGVAQPAPTPNILPSVGGSSTSDTPPGPLNSNAPASGLTSSTAPISPATATAGPSIAPAIPKALSAKTPAPSGSKAAISAKAKTDNKTVKSGEKLATKRGDTAGELAADHKPEGVSLDQMLLALLKANPQAFEGNNVNRLKSGVVLDLPDAQAVKAESANQARQSITAQARDFQAYKQSLAKAGVSNAVIASSRESQGKVTAKVTESKNNTAADKLTLSKPQVNAPGKDAAGKSASPTKEEKIAAERNAKESATRTAELSKNLSDLGKLSNTLGTGTTSGSNPTPNSATASAPSITLPSGKTTVPASQTNTAPATSSSSASNAPTAPAQTTSQTNAVAPTPGNVASASSGASSSSSAASGASPAQAQKPAVSNASPTLDTSSTPSTLDDLLSRSELPYAAGGLLAALLVFALWRWRKNKNEQQNHALDSSQLADSRIGPDSFFGVGGGQRVDTKETRLGGNSSSAYSLSQLDATGDVDPVAEADVYLAYNRDVQAEEILKEAKNNTPHRAAIHLKLMEIYAKRRDLKNFDACTHSLHAICRGQGTDWETAKNLAKEMNFSNSLFSQSDSGHPLNSVHNTGFGKSKPAPMPTLSAQAASAPRPSEKAPAKSSVKFAASTLPSPISTLAPADRPKPVDNSGAYDPSANMVEFDLSSFTLDLPNHSAPVIAAHAQDNGFGQAALPTGMDVKLSLAEEYLSMGDRQSAASLLQEVVQKGTAAQATKAQHLLSH